MHLSNNIDAKYFLPGELWIESFRQQLFRYKEFEEYYHSPFTKESSNWPFPVFMLSNFFALFNDLFSTKVPLVRMKHM